MIWLSATSLSRAVAERRRASEALRRGFDELEERVVERTAALASANQALQQQVEEREQAQAALERSEGQLRQSQKMEAIGRLAAGVAHDFNNLLTPVLGYCELARRNLGENQRVRADLDEVERSAQRAAELTRQLLAFSRQQVLQPRVIDLNGVTMGIDRMLRRTIGPDVDLVTLPGRDLGRVLADPGQVEQVLLNLAVNARDAMLEGGKLTIETTNVSIDDEFAREHQGVTPGGYVMIAVSDNGCGMDAETRARIFEPFFTTKELGKGTGLGLSTVHGIVKQSGGHIEVYSEPGIGTTFKVYLPRVAGDAEVEAGSKPKSAARGGTETVLVVEDEESVRRVVLRALRGAGYRLLECESAEEAIRVYESSSEPIDLLLTDVVMPEATGPEVARRLSPLRPGLRVLYMSGFTDHATLRNGVLEPGTAFLQKPFTPDALLRKVREILDEAQRRAA